MANTGSDDEAKEDRLQIRVEADLKEWFSQYAKPRGGMSTVVLNYIRRLRKKDSKDAQSSD